MRVLETGGRVAQIRHEDGRAGVGDQSRDPFAGAEARRVDLGRVEGAGGVVVQMPNGQLYNTISNGYNTMQGYAAQIPQGDRWAIVAYVRALQRAQNASQCDVPADLQGSIR